MNVITSEQLRKICDGVWRDRASILGRRGNLSGEDALVGAMYWRLCKAGRMPGESIADCAPFMRELMSQYRAEVVLAGEGHGG